MDGQFGVKCYECIYFKENSYMNGYGDCINKKVRGSERPMIWLHYCDDFAIKKDFGCIHGERNTMVLNTQEQRKANGAVKCSCGVYCATDKEGD